jgi:myo-inositol 2-dehydrogenase / D-chiro-inositol 1-dehydrogenase
MTRPNFDRRTLIKASAATAASAMVLSNLHASSAKRLDPIKVGLVGCGGRGTGAAQNALDADAGVVITAMGDCLKDRFDSSYDELKKSHGDRIQVSKDHQFIGFDAIDKVLAADIDVILLATPPHWRPMQIAKSIAAGKHTFAEKPMGVDAPGVRSIMESSKLAKQKKLSLMSGFCWRSSLPERAIYERIHDGAIGAIRTVYATYNGSPNAFVDRKPAMSDMEWQIRNWYHYLWLGGDHIVEQACHSVDKLNWAMNNEVPLRCWAIGGRQQRSNEHPGNIYDHFSVTYEYKDNRRAFLMARQWEGCANDNTDWVYGEKGIARINGWGPEHWIKGEKDWRYEGETKDMYTHEHEEFFAGIRSGKPRFDGDWMSQSTLMAIMGRMAAYTGKMVSWEEALNSQERYGPTEYAMGPVETTPVPRPGKPKPT